MPVQLGQPRGTCVTLGQARGSTVRHWGRREEAPRTLGTCWLASVSYPLPPLTVVLKHLLELRVLLRVWPAPANDQKPILAIEDGLVAIPLWGWGQWGA